MIDFSTIFSPLLSMLTQYWYIVPIVLIALFLKSPFVKGFIGEVLVNLALKLRLDKNKYRLIKNVTLPTEDGTTQIDHIIVSEFGIFVIETKNMRGWIFGNEKQKTWTQKIYKFSTKFQNPLHQNYKHTKTIESILDIDPAKVFSVVVFVGDSTFKTEMPENVTYAGGLIDYIRSKTEKVLSTKEVEKIISMVESGRLSRTLKTHRDHVRHVKNIVKEKKIQNPCPKCGSELALRVAKQGVNKGNNFYECSTYPRCRHTALVTT